MPIASTQSVSREIESLLFVNDGTLHVVLSKAIDGTPVPEKDFFRIEAPDASALLDVLPTAGLTVRQQIISAVYGYLITAGHVAGNIGA